jgi:hypothetical protein
LLPNAVERARGEVVVGVACDGDETYALGMLQLPMTASCSDYEPTLRFEEL